MNAGKGRILYISGLIRKARETSYRWVLDFVNLGLNLSSKVEF